ncbi:MAG: acetate--CoA ligase, partial [Thermoplasmata archaeon]
MSDPEDSPPESAPSRAGEISESGHRPPAGEAPASRDGATGAERLAAIRLSAIEDPEGFWSPIARELYFSESRGPIFEATKDPPYGRWLAGWKTNLSYNGIDRWLTTDRRDRAALRWEGEPGDTRTLTYLELHREVNRCAAMLRDLGVGPGDRVTLYLPMIPEALIAMWATVRLGAVHSVVFAGFAAPALADRLNDSASRVLITADGGWRRGRPVELKKIADEALERAPSVEHVVVVRRTGREVPLRDGRDRWYHEALPPGSPRVDPVMVPGTHPSFILYTSGTTGRPKGVVHSTGGYQLWIYYTMGAVFGPRPEDLFWCTADLGWVTGHSYVAYGPALRGVCAFVYEGAPDHPRPDRWFELIARHHVSVLYTSPTAIRGFMREGEAGPAAHDLRSLRLLGTVGEAINPAAWTWYHRVVGGGRLPIVDTYWQTETGGIVISPQPGIAEVPTPAGSATLPVAGIDAAIVAEDGQEVAPGTKGLLVIRRPWPGQFLGLWKDEDRFRSVYFARFPWWYYPADYGLRDADGNFWLLGRADEVMKIAGHRLSTKELEDILVGHPAVAEAAVIGRADPVKGEVPVACVILRPGARAGPEIRTELV